MEVCYTLAAGRGWMKAREDGARVICRVELEDDHRGLYKGYLLRDGRRFSLGALLPENGRLCLCRVLNREELCRRNLWPPTGGGVELAYAVPEAGTKPPPAGWSREGCPGRLMGDDLLRETASGLRGGLIRRTQEGFQLALPYVPGRPFQLTPLFCFAQPMELEGGCHLIYTFDAQGLPCFPQSGAEEGTADAGR